MFCDPDDPAAVRLLHVHQVFQLLHVLFPVDQVRACDPPCQTVDLSHEADAVFPEPGVKIQPLHTLADLDDIPGVLIIDLIVHAAPERQDRVRDLLKIQKRRRTQLCRIHLIDGHLDKRKSLAPDLLPQFDGIVIGPLQVGIDRIGVCRIKSIAADEIFLVRIDVRYLQKSADALVIFLLDQGVVR